MEKFGFVVVFLIVFILNVYFWKCASILLFSKNPVCTFLFWDFHWSFWWQNCTAYFFSKFFCAVEYGWSDFAIFFYIFSLIAKLFIELTKNFCCCFHDSPIFSSCFLKNVCIFNWFGWLHQCDILTFTRRCRTNTLNNSKVKIFFYDFPSFC